MAGWHHELDGREFDWTPGDDDGQGGLVCWDSRGRRESDTTEQLNWTDTFTVLNNVSTPLFILDKRDEGRVHMWGLDCAGSWKQ